MDKSMADKLMYITNEITSYVDYNYGLKRLDIDLMNQPIFHYLLVPKVVNYFFILSFWRIFWCLETDPRPNVRHTAF